MCAPLASASAVLNVRGERETNVLRSRISSGQLISNYTKENSHVEIMPLLGLNMCATYMYGLKYLRLAC